MNKGGIGAAVLLGAAACFQAAARCGRTLGDMAYGGKVETGRGVLPRNYRVMSAVAAVILAFGGWIVLARAGIVGGWFMGDDFLQVAVWVVFGFLVLNTLTNLAARSAVERWGMG